MYSDRKDGELTCVSENYRLSDGSVIGSNVTSGALLRVRGKIGVYIGIGLRDFVRLGLACYGSEVFIPGYNSFCQSYY